MLHPSPQIKSRNACDDDGDDVDDCDDDDNGCDDAKLFDVLARAKKQVPKVPTFTVSQIGCCIAVIVASFF